MAITVEKAVREFRFNGMILQDPNPAQSTEEVRIFYANIYPELTNAAIEGPEHKGNKAIFEFRKAVGTKGADPDPAETPLKFEQWGLVEIFGHTRIAGLISEQTIGGVHFVRVDVPEIEGQAAFTKLYTQGAIFGVTFTDERTCRNLVAGLRAKPINIYIPALPAPDECDYDSES